MYRVKSCVVFVTCCTTVMSVVFERQPCCVVGTSVSLIVTRRHVCWTAFQTEHSLSVSATRAVGAGNMLLASGLAAVRLISVCPGPQPRPGQMQAATSSRPIYKQSYHFSEFPETWKFRGIRLSSTKIRGERPKVWERSGNLCSQGSSTKCW